MSTYASSLPLLLKLKYRIKSANSYIQIQLYLFRLLRYFGICKFLIFIFCVGMCFKCGHKVIQAEEACQALGRLYHATCFVCSSCGKVCEDFNTFLKVLVKVLKLSDIGTQLCVRG